MKELDDFLGYCDNAYQTSSHCKCGEKCTNTNYCNNRYPDCYECIKRVHSYWNNSIHYNCPNMINYYVLKHEYRFLLEIAMLANRHIDDLNAFDDINIASIGCGPCSELFGLLAVWRCLGKTDDKFHFKGFDLEENWLPIIEKINEIFCCNDVKAFSQDCLAYYEGSESDMDVLVFNYMLSDMLKFRGSAEYSQFLDNLSKLIVEKKPTIILHNDVYLKISLEASRRLEEMIMKINPLAKTDKHQYGYNAYIGWHANGVEETFEYKKMDEHIKQTYDPFKNINSIQTYYKLNWQ